MAQGSFGSWPSEKEGGVLVVKKAKGTASGIEAYREKKKVQERHFPPKTNQNIGGEERYRCQGSMALSDPQKRHSSRLSLFDKGVEKVAGPSGRGGYPGFHQGGGGK